MTQTTISYITNDGSIIVENPPVSHFFIIDENNEYIIDVIDYATYDGQGTLYSAGEQYPLPINIYSCDGNLLSEELINESFGYDTFSEYMEENPNLFTFIGTLSDDNKILYVGKVDNTSSVLLNFENKTVSSLYIHNKEVQSIITNDNIVLYEKSSTPIPVTDSVNLVTTTNVVSHYHSDTATLTATVLDDTDNAIENATVEFFNGSTSMGTAITDSNGEATKTYSASGIGDVSFTAECDNITSSPIIIEDCWYFNDGTINDIVIASNGVVTVENGALKITTSYNRERKFYFPTTAKFTRNDNVEMILESARESTDDANHAQILGLSLNPSATGTSQGYFSYNVSSNDTGGYWDCTLASGTVTVNASLVKGDIIRFVRENGYSKAYHNDTLLNSKSHSPSNFYFGGYTNKNRVQRLKNIKIKAL